MSRIMLTRILFRVVLVMIETSEIYFKSLNLCQYKKTGKFWTGTSTGTMRIVDHFSTMITSHTQTSSSQFPRFICIRYLGILCNYLINISSINNGKCNVPQRIKALIYIQKLRLKESCVVFINVTTCERKNQLRK